MQGDRAMSATKIPLDGMANDSTSAVLTAVVKAVEWKHAAQIESDGSGRLGRLVVIYPPELDRLGTVLDSRSTNCDLADGHEIACEWILSASDSFENPPKFFPSDHEDFEGLADPPKVAQWMNLSSQIATAGRRQVAEDGPETCNSDSDSDTEQYGEVILDGYGGVKTDSNGNPISCEHRISNEHAEALRRATQSMESASREESYKGRAKVSQPAERLPSDEYT
jgi:hypothetical protein